MSEKEDTPIKYWQISAYAGPAMITSLAWMPLGYVIVKFYAKYTSLDIATIGTIILFARLFDAVSDPAIAWLSDSMPTKWGRRKPWIVLSAPITATGFALIFMPPSDIHWTYFLAANITLYVGWTFFEITHIAWGLEVVHRPEQRARLGVTLKVFAYIGSLLFFAFPFIFNPDPQSSEFTQPVMKALGLTIAISFPLLALFSVNVVPQEARAHSSPYSFIETIREIIGSRTFRFYAAAFICWACADAIIVALFLVYVDVYLDLSMYEGAILLAAYCSRLVAAPFAYRLLKNFSHKTLWCYATCANALLMPMVAIFPTGPGAMGIIMTYAAIIGVVDCLIGILVITLLGQVIDDDSARTHHDKAASYKAATNLIEKTGRALGTSSSLIIVGSSGLTVGGESSDLSIVTLIAVLAVVPPLLNLMSSFLMSKFPTQSEHVREAFAIELSK
ncbi:MFS transporter [Kineobactrum salinum]|uniref:MFS transporter n=1 Tax=Kineobactrum salinum TaxID=2708301 RepID=A0A6C0U019_9GAMM|nr:MFS transporter [Kineobactrum salinum]QIB65440.1 hypothetical protein G3T16_08535 [Kineobactrum salinum]